jgi:acetate---CoA ligase (ADP-forming)
LNLADEQQVAAAYDTMLGRVKAAAPDAQIDGVLLAPMIRGGVECIIGVHRDPVLGHLVMLGAAGLNVELLRDVSFRVAPVDREEATSMLDVLKTAALLQGFRGSPEDDTEALADAIVSLSNFAVSAGDSL